jgi:hypothetical protein
MVFATWPGHRAFASEGGEAGEEAYSFYYFKDPRSLKLDVGRIAVFHSSDGHGAEDLSPYGLVGSAEVRMAVQGWSFVTTTASIQTEEAIARAVSQIAGAELVEFVSPVFVDEEGEPIVITPDILVGFDRNLDAARAEAILAESQAGEILDRDWANMKRTYRLRSASRDGFEVLEAANALARRSEVTFAEPDMMVTAHAALIPDDTYFPFLWGLHNDGTFVVPCTVPDFDMDAPEAWDVTTGSPSIIVAILTPGSNWIIREKVAAADRSTRATIMGRRWPDAPRGS